MKDAAFIDLMVNRGKEAAEKIRPEFWGLSIHQLNWKPEPGRWSIGECLDHLVTSDCLYFPVLRKINEANHQMTFWERWNPFSVFFGRMLVHQLQETVTKKVRAPKIFLPSAGSIDIGILERFHKHQATLLEYIAGCRTIDLDRTHITSPVAKVITYSLRNAVKILIQHEHRHINQAIKVKREKDFPS